MTEDSTKEALRRLLLPIRPECEAEGIEAAVSVLAQNGLDEEDYAAFLRTEHARWRDAGKPEKTFGAAVRGYLEAGDPQFGHLLAPEYFQLHAKLSEQARFDHDVAAALLSHARLIAALAAEDSLSAAQVAKLLRQRDPRLPDSWVAVEGVLSAIGHKPRLPVEEVRGLFGLDAANEGKTFADANPETCIQLVATVATELGLETSLKATLDALLKDPFVPYLQMLHYLCTIAEFYDHPLEFLYEFNPRGESARWLSEQYPHSLGVSGNAFLNNAKSVEVLDRNWANSKKKAQSNQAHALVTIVEALSGLGFAARRELATWIRRLLVRVIHLAEGGGTVIPELGPKEIKALIEAVSSGPTNTLGILEQRLVDAVASLRYRHPLWVGRGLGDSVHATNVSKRKCGDCDFQDSGNQKVIAFEPHAGRLSEVYVRDHERTLQRVLSDRIQEWVENFGAGGQWTVSVIFVAHEIPSAEVLAEVQLPEVAAKIRAVTFADFLSNVDMERHDTAVAFGGLVQKPLMEPRTPESIRERVAAILARDNVSVT